MLLLRGAVRCLATSARLEAGADKTKLAKLRKITGYSFVNCKKALQQHDYDLERAEAWLREQAQAEGWAKASKLGARATPQGLVGVATLGRAAAMVELNCETDFVARNAVFDQLVREAAVDCLPLADSRPDDSISTVELATVAGADGRSLPDRVALAIGQLGENVTLGRAAVVRAGPATHLASYVHPGQERDRAGVHVGRYAAVVLFEMFDSGKDVLTPHRFGRNLCQHIVGMAPLSLGDPRPPAEADGSTEAPADGATGSGSGSDSDGKVETRLLDQEFLVEPDVTVRELLAEHNARVIDFARMECGETAAADD
ncbi:elongation factor Ts, mitochondrial-like [Pollicipes pollicipes]|uniref:elongation factor Ts, mitochondrial-like n=1 Tax=Pollicipes pollicipes TaxID=41117 RepID=UPI001885926C|nr:elongation factor Ts, mitochondrial-like [Pollicipes pollicipes]